MKKLLLIFVMLNLVQYSLFAQDQYLIDSLETKLKSLKAKDSITANILYQLSKAYWGNNPDKTMEYAEQTLTISEQIGFKQGIGNAYTSMGISNDDKGDYLQALEYYKKALKAFEEINDKIGIAYSYNNIGVIYDNQGKYPEALKNYFAGLKIFEEIADKKGIAGSYNNIGLVYENQGNVSEALKNYSASLKIRKEIGDRQDIAYSYSNIGNIYKKQGNYVEALKNLSTALKSAEEIDDKHGMAYAFNHIGNIYKEQKNESEALKNYMASLKIRQEIGEKIGIAECYFNIGKIYTKGKKYAEASEYLNKALAVSKEIGSLDNIKESYKGLSALDSAQGNYKQAFTHTKLYYTYRDSLFNKENTKKTVQTQMQYEFDKKEALTKAENERKTGKEKERRNSLIVLSAVFLAGLIIISYLYSRIKTANRKLSEQRNEIAEINKDLSENLRQKEMLFGEIHHRVKNNLQVISSLLEMQAEKAPDSFAGNSLLEGKKRIRSIALVHDLIYKQDDVSKLNMSAYFHKLTEEIQCALETETPVNITENCQDIFLPIAQAVPLGMLMNELITNSFKHAVRKDKTLEICIDFIYENEQFVLRYKDNGPGLASNSVPAAGKGLGMDILKSIARQLHGTQEYDMTDGFGFALTFKSGEDI